MTAPGRISMRLFESVDWIYLCCLTGDIHAVFLPSVQSCYPSSTISPVLCLHSHLCLIPLCHMLCRLFESFITCSTMQRWSIFVRKRQELQCYFLVWQSLSVFLYVVLCVCVPWEFQYRTIASGCFFFFKDTQYNTIWGYFYHFFSDHLTHKWQMTHCAQNTDPSMIKTRLLESHFKVCLLVIQISSVMTNFQKLGFACLWYSVSEWIPYSK